MQTTRHNISLLPARTSEIGGKLPDMPGCQACFPADYKFVIGIKGIYQTHE
jgi:hypothetical protein